MEKLLSNYSIRDIQLAYIAGFFDGEGMVTLNPRQSEYYLMIRASNNNEKPLRYMYSVFGCGNVRTVEPKGNRSLSYLWQCFGLEAASVLEQLLPYLQVKKELASLGIALVYTSVGKREDIANKIYELNSLHGKGRR